MKKLIMGMAALVLISAPARVFASNTPRSQEFMDKLARIPDSEATRLRKERERRAVRPQPPVNIYIYVAPPTSAPSAPVVQPKPQPPKPLPQKPKLQSVKVEDR